MRKGILFLSLILIACDGYRTRPSISLRSRMPDVVAATKNDFESSNNLHKLQALDEVDYVVIGR